MASKQKQAQKARLSQKQETTQGASQEASQSQKQKLAQSQKQKVSQSQSQKQKLDQLALYLSFLAAAVAGRAALQAFPSVEPITFFALLAGAIFGSRIGFMFGAKAMFLSNFLVFGGQGFWTPFQMLGMGIAGYLGGFLSRQGKTSLTFRKALPVALLATIIYEIIVTVGWSLTFGLHLIIISFIAAIPFALVHISSNAVFASLLPKAHLHLDSFSFGNIKQVFQDKIGKFESFK